MNGASICVAVRAPFRRWVGMAHLKAYLQRASGHLRELVRRCPLYEQLPTNVSTDIWAAYLTKQTTLIPTDLWIPRNYTTQEATVPLQDRYSNKAIWIFARIINELSEVGERGRETIIQTQNRPLSTEVLVNLWKELKLWRDQCPMSVKPLIELPPAEGDAFPMIIFGNQSAGKCIHPMLRAAQD